MEGQGWVKSAAEAGSAMRPAGHPLALRTALLRGPAALWHACWMQCGSRAGGKGKDTHLSMA